MRIGIIGASQEEVELIQKELKSKTSRVIANRDYKIGELLGHQVVVVFSGWGKVSSTITAVNLINNFSLDLIVFTGMAGAISPGLNIGDIVVAEESFQHDMDARPFFKKHQIPLTDNISFPSDKDLSQKCIDASNEFIRKVEKKISKSILSEFRIGKPKVWFGKIATGDQFIRSQDASERILEDMPDTLAVEMEGGGAVAQVCNDYNLPIVIVRTISDKADRSAHFDFLMYTNKIAKIYSLEILKEFLSLLK